MTVLFVVDPELLFDRTLDMSFAVGFPHPKVAAPGPVAQAWAVGLRACPLLLRFGYAIGVLQQNP